MDEVLDSQNREIRLASLLPKDHLSAPSPGSPSSDPNIQISLRKASLDDSPPPEYIALSYVWGDPKDTVPILVDGIEFPATNNLVSALRELQQDSEVVTIWVDAICIRQSENDEKSGQIQLMKQIYEAASTTVMWLGGEADGSRQIMKMIADFCARPDFKAVLLDKYAVGTRMSQFNDTDNSQGTEARSVWRLMLLDPTIPTDRTHPALLSTQSSLVELLNREYWRRVWCLQEMSVSSHTVIMCGQGGEKIDVDLFGKFVHYYHYLAKIISNEAVWAPDPPGQVDQDPAYKSSLLVGSRKSGAVRMLRQRRKYREAQLRKEEVRRQGSGTRRTRGLSLFDHLRDAYTSHRVDVALRSTDPRDMIYGLLNLADDVNELDIVPDYAKPYHDVFLEAWLAILRKRGDVDLLLWAVSSGHETSVTNPTNGLLPSWVPDWRQSREWKLLSGYRLFLACGHLRQDTQWIPTKNYDRYIITPRGVRIDTVLETGKVLGPLSGNTRYVYDLAVFTNEVSQFLQKSSSSLRPVYPNPPAVAEAVWRILLCDMELPFSSGRLDLDNPAQLPFIDLNRIRRATAASRQNAQSLIASLKSHVHSNSESVVDTETLFGVGGLCAETWINLQIADTLPYQRPFLTSRGWVGRGPAAIMPGDVVAILWGGRVPFVLRPCGDGNGNETGYYQLVGDAYVHGLMDGEFIQPGVEGKEEIFRIM